VVKHGQLRQQQDPSAGEMQMFKTAVLSIGIGLTIFTQAPVFAEVINRDSKAIANLASLAQDTKGDKIFPSRGGTKEKPLGIYGIKEPVLFKSGYKNVDNKTKATWAYDLHMFIVKNGGGWDNFKKYQAEVSSKPNAKDPMDPHQFDSQDPNDPHVKAHVSYAKQAEFADTWWTKNSKAYAGTVLPPKDWWTNDAILDGNNLWNHYEHDLEARGADYLARAEADLNELLKKQ